MPCGESGPFEDLRGQLGSLATHVLRKIEEHPDPETAYAQASQVRGDLQAASDEAAMVRAAMVLRIKNAGHLSVAAVGKRIGVTKARAQDMLEKAAKRPVSQPVAVDVADVPTVKRTRRIPGRGNGTGSSFAEEMLKRGYQPSTKLVQAEAVATPPLVAYHLGIDEGQEVLIRKRHMFVDERPVQLAASYIPLSIAGSAEIAFPDTGPTGMYERLAARGHRVVRFAEEIEVRHPSGEEAEFLGISRVQHVLQVTRFAYDRVARPLEVVINVFPSEQWRLAYEWRAADD